MGVPSLGRGLVQLLPLLAVAALGACAPESPPPAPAPTGRWHVAGGHLRDGDGRAAILRGANLANRHKWPPYFDFHQPADLRRAREQWGMDSLRLLVVWAAIEPAPDRFDEGYLDEVARRVAWAADAGLLVVVDLHQDVFGEGFAAGGGDGAPRWACDEARYAAFRARAPWYLNYGEPQVIACYDHFWGSAELRRHYVEAWRRLARRLAGARNVVGFDAMNEPFGGSLPFARFEPEALAPLYLEVTRAVRAEAPGWVAFLEPAITRGGGLASELQALPVGDVVYAPHSYDAAASAGAGFDPARAPHLAAYARALGDEARRLGAALWIGEYGGDPDEPGIGPYLDAQYAAFAAVGAGSAYYQFGADDSYGLLRPDRSEKTPLLDLLVRPWPSRVAGDPVDWRVDAQSTFTLRYRPFRGGAAPTEIGAPARAYPRGVTVECGGCVHGPIPGGQGVRLDSPPPVDESGIATVVLRPAG